MRSAPHKPGPAAPLPARRGGAGRWVGSRGRGQGEAGRPHPPGRAISTGGSGGGAAWRRRVGSHAKRSVPGAAARRREDGAGGRPPPQRGGGGGEGQDEEDDVSVHTSHARGAAAAAAPGGFLQGFPAAEPGQKVGGMRRVQRAVSGSGAACPPLLPAAVPWLALVIG